MTSPEQPATLPPRPPVLLPALQARLTGGVGPALAEAIAADATPTDPQDADAALTDPRLLRLLEPIDDLRRGNGLTPAAAGAAITAIAVYLLGNRRTLLLIVGHPNLLRTAMTHSATPAAADPVQVWLRCCWLVEAAWQATNTTTPPPGTTTGWPGEPFAATDLELLRPAAARQRFLLLTEPMRHTTAADEPGEHQGAGWPVDTRYGRVAGLAEDVFGTGAGHDVLGRCRQARWIWRRYLDHYQDHPLLATATGQQIEAELNTVVFRDDTTTGPLLLSWNTVRGDATATADDWSVLADLTERHLLPRLRILQVLRLGLHSSGRRLPATATAVLVAAAAATAAALAATGWFLLAALTAAGCYLLLAAGVVALGQAWAAIWLLRIPAAAALGLAALSTLHPDWWQHSAHWWQATVVLVAASYGYLIVEARNHGVPPGRAVLRALGVTAVGVAHAMLVTLIGVVAVVPEYAENGAALQTLFHHPGWPQHPWPAGTAWTVLASGTAWCLAAGVFSQILWDDRPLTAPLAHLRWKGDR